MSDIVLSASVRQNLLSLQSTADLLSTTQSRLATGNKVNSALDNPTNYFTALSLNNRASDINNLLDSVGNGVQVIQAANTGITSLQKLVDTAKSLANQALQATTGYSPKSVASSAAIVGQSGTHGSVSSTLNSTYNATVTGTGGFTATNTIDVSTNSVTFNVALDGASSPTTVTINAAAYTAYNADAANAGNLITNANTALTSADVAKIINYQVGANIASASGTQLKLASTTTGPNSELKITGYTSTLTAGQGTGLGLVNADTKATNTIDGTSATYTTTNKLDLTIDNINKQIDLSAAAVTAYNADSDNVASQITDAATALTLDDVAKLINYQFDSNVASVSGGQLKLSSVGRGADANVSVNANASSAALGLTVDASTDATYAGVNGQHAAAKATAENLLPADTEATVTGIAVTGLSNTATDLTAASGGGFAAGDSFTINGTTFNFVAGGVTKTTAIETDSANNSITVNLTYGASSTKAAISDLEGAIQSVLGVGSTATIDNTTHKLTLSAAPGDTATSIRLSGGALSKLGLSSGTTDPTSTHDGEQLVIGSIDGSTSKTITFGTGTGRVHTIADLNKALAGTNLTASVSADGVLSFTTTNDEASFDLSDPANAGIFSGSGLSAKGLFGASSFTTSAPVADANSQNLRASLVSQYNTVIDQIATTAQDASFNGVNLLNGDQLKLVFNETGKSTLNITGVNDDPTGLGLRKLVSGQDFIDNAHTNKILDSLTNASATLRTQASALGANLSVVQIRQDFSKNLINVLQTGASNLTLADTNEEAANSQALSTRQSIAVSALALANQSNQSVLRLLQ